MSSDVLLLIFLVLCWIWFKTYCLNILHVNSCPGQRRPGCESSMRKCFPRSRNFARRKRGKESVCLCNVQKNTN